MLLRGTPFHLFEVPCVLAADDGYPRRLFIESEDLTGLISSFTHVAPYFLESLTVVSLMILNRGRARQRRESQFRRCHVILKICTFGDQFHALVSLHGKAKGTCCQFVRQHGGGAVISPSFSPFERQFVSDNSILEPFFDPGSRISFFVNLSKADNLSGFERSSLL
jgi:hypothetical protein